MVWLYEPSARSGLSVDTPPDGETAMGPSLPTECEASCSAWAVDFLLAAWSYWKRVGFRKKGTSLGDYAVYYSLCPLGYQLYSQARIDLPQQQSRHMT